MLCVDIFGDNEGAMAIVNNPGNASRSKHIGVKSPFFTDLCVQEQLVFFIYETKDQYADIITNALCRKKFMVHLAGLMSLA